MCTRSIGSGGGIECAENGGAAIEQAKQLQQTDDESSLGTLRKTSDRIRDRNGFRRRAAAFCARIAVSSSENGVVGPIGCGGAADAVLCRWPPNLGALEVLMVSGRTAGEDGYWVLPGGGVENMESTEEAVLRELREEAGIRGKVLFCIGEFVDDQRFHHTTLFFLTVCEVFTEWGENCENGRQRRWMGMDEARQSIKHNQRGMLERSIKIIEQTLGDRLEPTVSKCLSAVPVVSLRAAEDGIHWQQQRKQKQRTMALSAPSAEGALLEEASEDGLATAFASDAMVGAVANSGAHDSTGKEMGKIQQQHHPTEHADEGGGLCR